MKPAIVVVTYNRYNSLRRLLKYLGNSSYDSFESITLIISIDYQNSESHSEAVKIANDFIWDNGEKRVIIHEKNLGLRNHILSCGDFSQEFGSVIVLEDDIVVSPNYYFYSQKALEYYENDNRIGGISLYKHKRNFCNKLPFDLLGERGSDVFFLQIASSWGQAWTANQWKNFRKWYDQGQEVSHNDLLPDEIISWPQTSWLKFFIKYLVVTNKYFVYPKISLSTNFGDGGTHNLISNSYYQVPLDMTNHLCEFKFISIDQSNNVFDSFFEIKEAILRKLISDLKVNFMVDIYGLKDLNKYSVEYIISSKKFIGNSPIRTYGINVKPIFLNVILENEGMEVVFGKRVDFVNDPVKMFFYVNKWDYFSNDFGMIILLKRLYQKFLYKLKEKF